MPVSGSITVSLRCSTSERVRAVESIATAITRVIGATRTVGSWATALAAVEKATVKSSASVNETPATTPRREKRELSVTTGMANHDIVAVRGPPLSATDTAIATSAAAQAA
jgi:hypothetical protein